MDYDKIYDYESLETASSIRVLRLEPSRDSTEPLHGTLTQVTLVGSPKYDALSYTWGSDFPNVKATGLLGQQTVVNLKGQWLPISENCGRALRRLRNRHTHRDIWVDSICINQRSISERNSQVSIMAKIYQSARRVVVWLGNGDRDSELMFKYMHRLSRSPRFWFERDMGQIEVHSKTTLKTMESK
jgi:hypothetical protein